MSDKTGNKISLIINAYIVISAFIVMIVGVCMGAGEGQVGDSMRGLGYFKAFTIDSNVLMGLIALMGLTFNINNLVSKKIEFPKWMTLTYLTGTTAVALTFVTVVVFLAPMFEIQGDGYMTMFVDDMFFYHLVNPIMAIVNLIFFLPGDKITGKVKLVGLIPTFIYSIIYTICVAVLKIWSDFYNFTFGGKFVLIPLVLLVMYAATFGLSCLICFGRNKRLGKNKKAE